MSVALLVIAIGYLLGSIPVSDIVAHRAGAPNLRDVGDQNPGFWNSRTVFSRNQSLAVFVGDLLKGVLSVVTAQELSDRWQVWFLAAGAAMIGHGWPLFARLKGGFSHGVRIGVVLYPFAQWYADGVWWAAATGALMSIIGVRFAMAIGIDSVLAATPLSRWRNNATQDDDPSE